MTSQGRTNWKITPRLSQTQWQRQALRRQEQRILCVPLRAWRLCV